MADELKNTKMKHWQNDNDKGKLKYLKKNLSQCHAVHHKSNMGRPGETGASAVTGRRLKCLSHDMPVPHTVRTSGTQQETF